MQNKNSENKILMVLFIIIGVVFTSGILFHMNRVDNALKEYEKEIYDEIPSELMKRDVSSNLDRIETQDYYFNSFKDSQKAYLNAYLNGDYERAFVVADNVLNQYKDGELNLNLQQYLISQFNLYDANLQILLIDKYDYLYENIGVKYEVMDFIFTQILSYKNDKLSYEIIKKNTYLSNIFQLAVEYENKKLK